MYTDLHILTLAAAAVLDTVLLLAVADRRNRPNVLAPVVVLILGGWLWHVGAVGYAVLAVADPRWAAWPTWVAMTVMTVGLLLMPSAVLHGVWRIRRTGTTAGAPAARRYLWAYLPLAAVVPVGWLLARGPAGAGYLDRVRPAVPAYGAWLAGATLAAAVGFVRLRRAAARPRDRRFFAAMAAALVSVLAFHAFALAVAVPAWPGHRADWLLAVMLTPVVPAGVFAYSVVRHGFMELVVERAAVYAAVAVGGLLAYELAVRPLTARLGARLRMNLSVAEVLVLLAVAGGYSPLRQRVAEALRYLMGERVAPVRDRTRRLAVRISERALDPPDALLAWFAPALREALDVGSVHICLFGTDGEVAAEVADAATGTPGPDATAEASAGGEVSPAALCRKLRDALRSHGSVAFAPRDAPNAAALADLRRAAASLAIALRHEDVDGLLLVGRRPRNRDLVDEQANAAVLLAEQLAVTLNAGRLQADRLAAERRALQAEKLATLGLVAGSIAHEVRNPLSSIRAIATVLAEDLGPDDPRAEDARMIRAEADRMAAATARLLRFARPANPGVGGGDGGDTLAGGRPVAVADVLAGTLYVMGHLARQRGVSIDHAADDDLPPVAADEDGLREVFTNLIANAIEAAAGGATGEGGGGTVSIAARRTAVGVRVEVADNGPGVPDAVRRRLFEPFVTARAGGTGLGLYVVSRRVREAGGTIRCDSPTGRTGGTRFVVELPAAGGPVELPLTEPGGGLIVQSASSGVRRSESVCRDDDGSTRGETP